MDHELRSGYYRRVASGRAGRRDERLGRKPVPRIVRATAPGWALHRRDPPSPRPSDAGPTSRAAARDLQARRNGPGWARWGRRDRSAGMPTLPQGAGGGATPSGFLDDLSWPPRRCPCTKLWIVFTQSAPGFPAIAVMRLSGERGLYRRAGREHDGQAALFDDAPRHPLAG